MLWPGFVFLALGIVATVFMHWIIDPKLGAVSADYEERQAGYLEDLERGVRWEKPTGAEAGREA